MTNNHSIQDFEAFSKRVLQAAKKELSVFKLIGGGGGFIGVGAVAPFPPFPIPIMSLKNAKKRLKVSIYNNELDAFLRDNYFNPYQQIKNDPQAIEQLVENAKKDLLNHLLTL